MSNFPLFKFQLTYIRIHRLWWTITTQCQYKILNFLSSLKWIKLEMIALRQRCDVLELIRSQLSIRNVGVYSGKMRMSFEELFRLMSATILVCLEMKSKKKMLHWLRSDVRIFSIELYHMSIEFFVWDWHATKKNSSSRSSIKYMRNVFIYFDRCNQHKKFLTFPKAVQFNVRILCDELFTLPAIW